MPGSRLSSKARALASLHEQIRSCGRCPLHLTRTQAVPGVGPADAQVMFVGEAPGRQEDLRGEPFVGNAGRFFDELLASVGLARDRVFITNVVKSRPFIGPPPGRNRAPAAGEIVACRPWLEDQIRIIEPQIVVLMGRVALECFFPKKKISEVHGQALDYEGRTMVALFHPAVASHGQPQLADALKQDFLVLGRLLAQHTLPAPRPPDPQRRSLPARVRRKEGPRRPQKPRLNST